MEWFDHSNLSGRHAFLSASSHNWVNYSPEHLKEVYFNKKKAEEGTELHALASQCIKHRVKLARLKKAFNMFVNDAIGFNMQSEQMLYYSDFIFGTADAITFDGHLLRIHDLKTGMLPVKKFTQLDIYSALFTLEYNIDPRSIEYVERLYQGNTFTEYSPDPNSIHALTNKIIDYDKILDSLE